TAKTFGCPKSGRRDGLTTPWHATKLATGSLSGGLSTRWPSASAGRARRVPAIHARWWRHSGVDRSVGTVPLAGDRADRAHYGARLRNRVQVSASEGQRQGSAR